MESSKLGHRVSNVVVATLAILGFMLVNLAVAPIAAAQEDPFTTFAVANMALLIVIAVITLAAAFFVKGIKGRNRRILMVVGFIAVGLLVLAIATTPISGPPPPGIPPPLWVVYLDTPPAGADADTETLDSQGFTACDGGTPDLNGEVNTATNKFYDNQTMISRFMSDQDDDVSRTTVAFHEIDCIILSGRVALENARDVNGDGTNDAVVWGMQLISLGPVVFGDGNQTQQNIIFLDADAGWECAYFNEGSEWISTFGGNKFALQTPTTGPYVGLGTHSGGGTGADTWTVSCVFDTTVGAPSGYTIPAQVGGEVWHATFAVGTPNDMHQATASWVLQSRA